MTELLPIFEYQKERLSEPLLDERTAALQSPNFCYKDFPPWNMDPWAVTFTLDNKINVVYEREKMSINCAPPEIQYAHIANILAQLPKPKTTSFAIVIFFEYTVGGVIHAHALCRSTIRGLHTFCNAYKRQSKSFSLIKKCDNPEKWFEYMIKDQQIDSHPPLFITN